MNKRIFHQEIRFIEISIIRIVLGLIIWISYSIIFYSFLYLIREGFRFLSVTENYDLWILNDTEVNFYNLVYAFISVIFGQSLFFSFLFKRPRKMFEKLNHRKISIVNDQNVLTWSFLDWFAKLACIFGLWFGFVEHSGFYVFSFYPDYNYFFILIIIVLFLNTWNGIVFTFKRKSFKWLIASILVTTLMSFGLSKINIFDYKKFNSNCLDKCVSYKYNLDLPFSNSYSRLEKRSLVEKIYFLEAKESKQSREPVIVVENNEITIEELGYKIKEWQSYRDDGDITLMVYDLYIHHKIKMKSVNKLKTELSRFGVWRIAYAVTPSIPQYDAQYYQDIVRVSYIPDYYKNITSLKSILGESSTFRNIIEIKEQESGSLLLNNNPISVENLRSKIKELILKNSDYIINFYINDNADFSDYFNINYAISDAIFEIRNDYSFKTFSKEFENLDSEEQNYIKELYPIRVIELTTDLVKKLENT